MKVCRKNQYNILKSCILSYPAKYRITNKSNKFYNDVNYSLALDQYNKYVNYLIKNDVKPIFVDISDSSKQVYSKDTAFVIEDLLFISKMSLNERQKEIESIKKFVLDEKVEHYIMKNNIEGGDVEVLDKVVFVGVSSRTNLEAIKELKEVLAIKGIKKEVIPINFDNNMLHLDCVFSLLGKDSAIVSPYVYDKEVIKKYIKNIIGITKEEAEEFGSNIVYLGNNKLVTSNINVGNRLKELGYEVEILNFSEIVKGGGSFDCCTLELFRS